MTLPTTGPISFNAINIELGRTPTANLSLNDTDVRNMAGKPSGIISLADLRGKSKYVPMTVVGNDDYNTGIDSSFSGGTAFAYPSVNVSGGSGGYTFSWTMTSNFALIPTLSNATSSQCTLSRSYAKNSSGSFDTRLSCTVTDNTGHSVTVTNVTGYADWGILV